MSDGARVNMKTVKVGSHLALIPFGGIDIPIGFLTAFRKRNHHDCEGAQGFIRRRFNGKIALEVCSCASTRAIQRFKAVGQANFKMLSEEWLAAEKARMEIEDERIREEGYNASPETECPYPLNSDQNLVWHEGKNRKTLPNNPLPNAPHQETKAEVAASTEASSQGLVVTPSEIDVVG